LINLLRAAGDKMSFGNEEPDGTLFKGFMAWCLWGHIPIPTNDADMKSLQFSDTKVGTGYGRNTGSRRALKEAELLLRDGDSNLDNRRDRTTKKQKRGSPKDDNEDTTISLVMTILRQILQLLQRMTRES
jgi:hypothetical protein